jgi:hypothetical protein
MVKQLTKLLPWIVILIVLATTAKAEETQQINVSATPASITLPSPLPFTTQEQILATATYTPSPPGSALLEAITEANVRAEPDPESERLGTIRSGEVYNVIGRYYRWFQFQYNQSPSGTGWVFDELVNIAGDESRIVDLSENALPTADNTALAATSTMEAITLTPGGILTATAASSVVQLPIQPGNELEGLSGSQPNGTIQILPTFTYPPEVAVVPPENAYSSAVVLNATPTLIPNSIAFSISEGVPPLVPILILGGVGLLGLFITSYKR